MSTSTLSSPAPLSFSERQLIVNGKSTSNVEKKQFHLEIAFLNRSRHWVYRIQQSVKRLFDLLAASLGLLAISPLLVLIALLIKLTSEGPILYKSQRIGKNFQPFGMYKFRTMGTNADAQREALRKQAQLENGLFKLANDPRVTPIGKILRAFSLDELPQLINVVKGDMSLVGPRPLPRDESELFQEPYTLRFLVLPGMTGAWQVGGRSNIGFEQLCQLEMTYVFQWSLLRDIQILLKTLPAVLASRGAY
jgi:lipopolysaccharide/colanic/teichoic acid biosynthesis glycosyltransferase